MYSVTERRKKKHRDTSVLHISCERTPILCSGTAFTAQKRFLAKVKSAIVQVVETPVTKYQSVLQYARRNLDFMLGAQLYMCPSDMMLASLAGQITGYNNKILVATKNMSPGQNNELNLEKKLPPIARSRRVSAAGTPSIHNRAFARSQTLPEWRFPPAPSRLL